MPEKCHACGVDFDDFKSLAQHIISKKDTNHKKGKRWAHRFLMKQKFLDQRKDNKPIIPLTEKQIETRQSLTRELSGEVEQVSTLCPQCKRPGSAALPVEYVQGDAWQINGKYVLLCNPCRG